MREFNLAEALAGKPVITRDGRPVKFAGYNEEADEPVIGWLAGMAEGWQGNGVYILGGNCSKDLFMAPTERKEWIVRVEYEDGSSSVHGPWPSLKKAECYKKNALGANPTIHEITIIE